MSGWEVNSLHTVKLTPYSSSSNKPDWWNQMERDSVILRTHFLGVEYRPWESLWPGSPSQNSLFSSCFCHTWDRLGPGLRSHQASKCKDTIKGEKVLHACTVGTIMSNKIQNDQAPTATTEVLGAKQGSEYKPTHNTTNGVGRPPKPRLLPHPRICPHLQPI